jgi:hypothetical protein
MIKETSHSRAIAEVIALVGQARPHLVDVWDVLAVLESSGYTDARVNREFGLTDTRELAELVYAELSSRPLPSTTGDSAAAEEDARPRLRTTIAIAVLWAAVVFALSAALRIPAGILRLALVPSVVVCSGFVEAMRRRGIFYAAIGQPQLARVTCWYFMRLAAFVIAMIAAAGAAAGWLVGVTWPVLALWADSFVVASALWLIGGAAQVPGMLSRRKTDPEARVPIPRMTVVAYRELRVLIVTTVAAIGFGLVLWSVAGYAAVGIIGVASLTFVLSTLIGRWSTKTRSASFS